MRLLCSFGLVAVLAFPIVAIAEEPFTFRFDPPVGAEFVRTITTDREKVFEGLGSQVDHSVSKDRGIFEKAETGYTLTARPISMERTRDGQAEEDPISTLLLDLVITYEIDENGQILTIEGFGGLLEKVKAIIPPEMLPAIEPMVNEEALMSREQAEWDGRISSFVGGEFRIGEGYDSESVFPLQTGGAIEYSIRTWFPAFEPCPSGECVRIEMLYDSNASAMNEALSKLHTELGSLVDEDAGEVEVAKTRISGTASRLIDPNTMQIFEETVTRLVKMEVEIPGRGMVPMTMTETKVYTFEYP